MDELILQGFCVVGEGLSLVSEHNFFLFWDSHL